MFYFSKVIWNELLVNDLHSTFIIESKTHLVIGNEPNQGLLWQSAQFELWNISNAKRASIVEILTYVGGVDTWHDIFWLVLADTTLYCIVLDKYWHSLHEIATLIVGDYDAHSHFKMLVMSISCLCEHQYSQTFKFVSSVHAFFGVYLRLMKCWVLVIWMQFGLLTCPLKFFKNTFEVFLWNFAV